MWRTPLGDESRGIAESEAETDSPKGHTMYEYEISQIRSAELIRTTEQERRAREVVRGRRAARREAAAEHETHTSRLRRLRSSARAA